MRVLLVGGHGGCAGAYERVAAALGHELAFHERGALPARTSARSQPGAVLVAMSMCAHPLREAAQELARITGARYVPLRGHSVSEIKKALAALGRAA